MPFQYGEPLSLLYLEGHFYKNLGIRGEPCLRIFQRTLHTVMMSFGVLVRFFYFHKTVSFARVQRMP